MATGLLAIFGALAFFLQEESADPPLSTVDIEKASEVDFTGSWKTTFGGLVFTQEGDEVTGTYGDESTVTGRVNGRRLTFSYTEPSERGEGWFELAEDGQTFNGRWREHRTAAFGSWKVWNGERVVDTLSLIHISEPTRPY